MYSASAEKVSEHPLADAILKRAKAEQIELQNPEFFNAIEGHGIEATIGGKEVLLGNLKLMQDRNIPIGDLESKAEKLAKDAKTPIYVALAGKAAGLIGVADTLKDELHSGSTKT